MKRHRPSRRAVVAVAVSAAVATLVLLGPALYVAQATSGRRFAPADAPAAPVAIVFGAGISGDEGALDGVLAGG